MLDQIIASLFNWEALRYSALPTLLFLMWRRIRREKREERERAARLANSYLNRVVFIQGSERESYYSVEEKAQ